MPLARTSSSPVSGPSSRREALAVGLTSASASSTAQTEHLEHVGARCQRRGPKPQERVRSGAERGRDLARTREHLATSSSAKSAVINAPLRSRASTTTVACASPAMIRLRAESATVRAPRQARTRRRQGGVGDPPCELGVGRRVVAIDAAAQHGDRRAAGVERAAMRLAVDSARETADHHEPGGSELAAEHPGDLRAVRRAGARADDRDRGPCEHVRVAGAPRRNSPLGASWIAVGERREAHVDRASQRGPRRSSAARYLAPSNAFLNAAKRADRSSSRGWMPRLGGEGGKCELAHAVSSLGARYESASATCSDRPRPNRRARRSWRDTGDTSAAAAGERQRLDGTREQRIGGLVALGTDSSRRVRAQRRAPRTGSEASRPIPRARARAASAPARRGRSDRAARATACRVRRQALRRARAREQRIASRAARAEVHRPDELEARRVQHRPSARATLITPSSSGWRSASSAGRTNSGSSSSSSTPRCARLASPGRGPRPPPTIAAADALWCGARNGGVVTSGMLGAKDPRHRVDSASPRAPRRPEGPGGAPGSGARASSSRCPAARRRAGCARRSPRSRARARALLAADVLGGRGPAAVDGRSVRAPAPARARRGGRRRPRRGATPAPARRRRARPRAPSAAAQMMRGKPARASPLRPPRRRRRPAEHVRRGRARRGPRAGRAGREEPAPTRRGSRARSGGRTPSPPCAAPPARG